MIKGLLLGISEAILIVSMILIITGAADILKPNLITGNAIGEPTVIAYSFVALFLSLITATAAIFWMFENSKKED